MREPDLPESFFRKDHIIAISEIFSLKDFLDLPTSSPSGDAAKFCSSKRLDILLKPKIEDFSSFNCLSLIALNCCYQPLLVGITLVHSFSDRTEEPREFSFSGGREELAPHIWQELKFPPECFGSYGHKVGWDHIEQIRITFVYEKDYFGPEEIKILLKSFKAESREIPEGPRLTMEGLASVLAKDVQGVTDFFQKKDSNARNGRLSRCLMPIEYGLHIPEPHPYPKESVESLLKGRIMGQNLGSEIDWRANPLEVQEWTHFLNRHHFMRQVVLAFIQNRAESYAEELSRLISHWIKFNPVPLGSNGGAGPSWETLSIGWRLREWFRIVEHVWDSPAFSKNTKLMMLRSIWEHAESLVQYKGHPNNWIIVEAAALTLVGLYFPEFRKASEWVQIGMQRLRDEFCRQFFRDGVHFEISPMYHAICLHAILEVKLVADKLNIPLPSQIESSLEKSFEYLLFLCRPDFTWPSLNDSGSAKGDYTALLSCAAEVFKRDDFKWAGSRGTKGSPSKEKLRVFQDAGIAVMRSHYGPDANFLVFRAGPPGTAHAHGDVLSVDVSSLGHPRLVDPGITGYAPDELTEYYRSAAAHNTILIDGKSLELSSMRFIDRIRSAENNISFVQKENIGVVAGVRRGLWGESGVFTVSRKIYFVKGEYWIILDKVEGKGEHEITICWQFAPGRVELNTKNFSASYIDAKGACLELIPLLGNQKVEIEAYTGCLSPPRGWVSVDGADLPATHCRYNIKTVFPISIVWALLPFSGRFGSGVKVDLSDDYDRVPLIETKWPTGRTERIRLD